MWSPKQTPRLNQRTGQRLFGRGGWHTNQRSRRNYLYCDHLALKCRQRDPTIPISTVDTRYVTLLVVPIQGEHREVLLDKVRSALERLAQMFRGLIVDVKIEEEINPSNSGKMRFILNEIPQDFAK